MPLQNRVHPKGELVATPERGTMMGNRGGKFHRDDKTLGKRRWATHHWICCDLHYKNMHHEAMGDGYTSLFFLDEVTALAAGHRPCFFCRRGEAKAFLGDRKVDPFDRQLRAECRAEKSVVDARDLPDGAMLEIDGEVHAVKSGHLLHWSFAGYTRRVAPMRGKLLTPPSIIVILQRGYSPRWHPTGDIP